MVYNKLKKTLRNKIDNLIGQITSNINILMVSEIKRGERFLVVQFLIEGFSVPYQLDMVEEVWHLLDKTFFQNLFFVFLGNSLTEAFLYLSWKHLLKGSNPEVWATATKNLLKAKSFEKNYYMKYETQRMRKL